MRKFLIVFVLVLLLALTACTPATSAPVTTATPALLNTPVGGIATPDQHKATPAVGAVTVLQQPGTVFLILRSLPDPHAVKSGQVKPGDAGKLLGVDSTGLWMLVEIEDQVGWAPVQYLDFTVAQ